MDLAILASSEGWHVRDLQRAASELTLDCRVVDYRQLIAGVECSSPPVAKPAAVVVRTMPLGSLEQVIFRMDVLHQWHTEGVRVINPPRALETCIDKYLSCARLRAAGLPVPATFVCQEAEEAMAGFERLGEDVVVKPIFGSEGRGMVRVTDRDIAWRTFKTLERIQAVIYLQEFIHHPGWDLRVFVLGGRILGSMRRHSQSGWKTNVAQGGIGEAVAASDSETRLALQAARVTGIAVGGVDLLRGEAGQWYVLEVNAVPGWRSLGQVCRVDVARKLLEYIIDGKE
jgi:ribosomal protein S6--L-glutamate ligase